MKLLLITAVQEFENSVKEILNQSGVNSFSYQEVLGYKNLSEGHTDHWFGTAHTEIGSVLFTVFVQQEFVDAIYRKVEAFNVRQQSLSQIHVATVAIEKSI